MHIEGVRFCAVRDFSGQTLAGGQTPGVSRVETDEERSRSAARTGLISGLLEAMPESFGRVKSMLVEFERLKLLVFPLGDDKLLQVTTETNTPDIRRRMEEMVSTYREAAK